MNDQLYFSTEQDMTQVLYMVSQYFPEAFIQYMPEEGSQHQFGVTVPDALGDDYVLFAMRRNFALNSKGLTLMMNSNPWKFQELFNRWRLETGKITQEEFDADVERRRALDAEYSTGAAEDDGPAH